MGLFDFLFKKTIKVTKSDKYTFEMVSPSMGYINQMEPNELINIWRPSDDSFLNVYRDIKVGGTGLIGKVPKSHMKILIEHMEIGDQLDVKIIDYSPIMEVSIISADELQLRKGKEVEEFLNVLNKPYRPKAKMKYEHYVHYDAGFKVNDKIEILTEFDPNDIELKVKYKGNDVRPISSTSACTRIIRAHNSGYKVNAIIKDINYWEGRANTLNLEIEFTK